MKRILYFALCLFLVVTVSCCFVACENGSADNTNETGETSTLTTDPGSQNTNGGSNTGTTDTGVPSTDTTGSVTQNDKTDPSGGTTDTSTQGSGTTDTSTPDSGTTDSENPSEHVHTFADVYTFDGEKHYYAATCEHTDEMKGLEPHNYNVSGVCKCGHSVDITFYQTIKAILENRDAIKSVNSSYTAKNLEFASVGVTSVMYKYFEDYLYVKEENENKNEYYYAYDKHGEIFGVCVQNDGAFVFRVEEATDSNYNGALFTLSCIGDGETSVYGTEALVEYLYKMGLDDVNGDFTTAVNDGVYSFSYMICVVDDWMDYLYQVNVSFTLEEQTGAMATASIVVNRYDKAMYTVSDGKYTLVDDAKFNMVFTYEIQQSTALNDAASANPYDPDKITVEGLTLKDKSGKDILKNVVRFRAGDEFKIFFKDIKPATALFQLCKTTFTLKNKVDGTDVNVNPFFNTYDNSYSFIINTPGAYLLVITVDDIQFNATLEVDLKIPSVMAAQVYDAELGSFKQAKSVTVYEGTPLYISSYVGLDYDGSFRATLGGDYGTGVTLTAGALDGKRVAVFKADTVGKYVVNVISAIDSSKIAQLRVNVVEAPPLEDFLLGEYFAKDKYGKEQVRVVFDSNHNAVVTYPEFETDETLACTIKDGEIVFESIAGDKGLVTKLCFDDNYNLIIGIDDDTTEDILLTRVKVEEVLVNSGKVVVDDGLVSTEYAFEYYSTNKFKVFKKYSMTDEVVITSKNGTLFFRFAGEAEAAELVKISGESGVLAGKYAVAESVTVEFILDDAAAPIREPQFGSLQVIDINNPLNPKYSGYYTYEIVNNEFVFYKDGEVTDEISLVGEIGDLAFLYPGTVNAIVPDKILGEDDVLEGEYNINVNVGMIVTIAKIVIIPGNGNSGGTVVEEEEDYGSFLIVDDEGEKIAYTYEIIDGAFVIYYDGVVTNDVIIVANEDGTYTYQTVENPIPQILEKVEGEDKLLTGVYTVNDITITFMAGVLPDEADEGTIEIVDVEGNISGEYSYVIIGEAIYVYDKNGETVEERFIITLSKEGIPAGFQCATNGLYVTQPLIKESGMSNLVGGEYVVKNPEGAVIYTLTFNPGAELVTE